MAWLNFYHLVAAEIERPAHHSVWSKNHFVAFQTLIQCCLLSWHFSSCQISFDHFNRNLHAINEEGYLVLCGAWLRLEVGFTGNDVVAVVVVVVDAGIGFALPGQGGERGRTRKVATRTRR